MTKSLTSYNWLEHYDHGALGEALFSLESYQSSLCLLLDPERFSKEDKFNACQWF